ncbi:hypothetical protein HMPREF1551_01437 [Capnocytophaga sp. oral taxon 863 str. F0517]|nr:hypothetical protein HMPREF1551_01437 [Capnocytophaga sp. oral taxon 863 str. F0517]
MKYLKLLLIKTIQNKNSLYFFILFPNDKYSTLSEGGKILFVLPKYRIFATQKNKK